MLIEHRMQCPTCLKETLYNGNPWRPFCSERCKLIDLGRWASEDFRIPATGSVPDAGDAAAGGAAAGDDEG